uniref:Rad60/SUMO-like domain-containing protein n=1 Tax=Mantoniella antarctica TaxID=81844 RepID=A0A7S0T422_9CHLO|mmetsp:Transcript_6846/g.17011  ORF Transcript_6846/g.17011 Transcript_6846/m.17011 type:complete len:318 (+) Transcript_6846:242-1195(+)
MILKGQAAMLGNRGLYTDLPARIPFTHGVSKNKKVAQLSGSTLVALHTGEADIDVDLANPATYTLVHVPDVRSGFCARCEDPYFAAQLNESLFCSLNAANTPSANRTPIQIHLRLTDAMQHMAWRANNPVEVGTLSLLIHGGANTPVRFVVRRSAPLRKLYQAYCARMNIDAAGVRNNFLIDGQCICWEQTPESSGMENGDRIDFFPPRTCSQLDTFDGIHTHIRDRERQITGNVDVTFCIPGERHVTVSIEAHRNVTEAASIAALQLQLEGAEARAVEERKTMGVLQLQLKAAEVRAVEEKKTIADIKKTNEKGWG